MLCWHCRNRDLFDDDTCRRCGVWLIELRDDNVPASIVPLLSLARRWGIPDDGYRWGSVERATERDLDSVITAVDDAPNELWDWLVMSAGDEAPSAEYVALTCLTMAYDQARVRRDVSGES